MTGITNNAALAQSALAMLTSGTPAKGTASNTLNMGQMPTGGASVVSGGSPMAGSGTVPSAANNSDISSNDFLTLLVSELKNQDPTQPTDPNAYISQLVGVNSLQQLISINQDLTPSTNGAGTTGATATTAVAQ